MTKPRVLSGIQTSGNLHLGNYLGAIKNWVGLQDSHECVFMLADLHAITVPQNPADLLKNTREVAAGFIACGIDPNKAIIFPQSAVSAHAELGWILGCYTPLGWLNRMTQFKEKAQIADAEEADAEMSLQEKMANIHIKETGALLEEYRLLSSNLKNSVEGEVIIKNLSETLGLLKVHIKDIFKTNRALIKEKNTRIDASKLGLYSYPVLQAADILGYHATHVPVGEDQKQHLELARDIAGAFNRACGEDFFPLPQPMIMPTAARIMSLKDGTKKMSKSDPSELSRITLIDDADAIATKFRKAQTDAIAGITYEPETRPSIANLLTIFAALSGSTPQAVAEKYASAQNSQFKSDLADVAVAALSPITSKMRELLADTATIDAILARGAEAANALAQPVLRETMKRVGFWQRPA